MTNNHGAGCNLFSCLQGKVILCVEDEDLILSMYEKRLAIAGAEVLGAIDGEQALNILAEKEVDIVLLDLEMPNMDGVAVLESLSKSEKFSSIPVLILSNSSRVDDYKSIVALKEMGAVEVILKSNISLVALVERISELLALSK
ncbi:response regulator transcription factor [Candidatus Kaiserbacteria bacterium]|nr:response regulator transcription factor [Candidatus Kaiserbacteria bacterium]